MKQIFLVVCITMFTANTYAQSMKKNNVYGEIGLGAGQTLFFKGIRQNLDRALGGTFEPGIGNNLMMAFYVAPERLKGLGVGTRIKGTFGTSVKGENDDDRYIFNYYNLSASLKYYFVSRQFNKGVYTRASLGFGQFTSKRVNDDSKRYTHQYAIGSTTSIGVGYTISLKTTTVSFESEFESSSRNGTIDGVGDATFRSGQLGANIVLTF